MKDGMSVVRGKGSWFIVTAADGATTKINGRKALDEHLAGLAKDAPEDETDDVKDDDTENVSDGEIDANETGNEASDDDWRDDFPDGEDV